MGSASPLQGTAGSQEGLQGEPLPWRLLPGSLGEARSPMRDWPQEFRDQASLLPASLLPPSLPQQRDTIKSGKKSKVFIYILVCT